MTDQTHSNPGRPPAEIAALLDATRAQIAGDPALGAVSDDCLDQPLAYCEAPPHTLPSLPVLRALGERTAPRTQALADAIMAAAPLMHWQQSYNADQVGQDFLDNYGWFDLVAPGGPYVSPSHRISFGYWGDGLVYPRHWHAPEEIYLVVAGRARFITDGMEDALLEPGGTRFHPSNVPHGAAMSDGPLLAMAIWRGERLSEVSTLAPRASR